MIVGPALVFWLIALFAPAFRGVGMPGVAAVSGNLSQAREERGAGSMTLDPTVNAVIIGMSGFFIGAVSFVAGALDPANAEGRPSAPMPFKRGYLWGYFIAGFFLGFLALQGVYALALKGRVGGKTPRFLERLVEPDSRNAPGAEPGPRDAPGDPA